MGKGFFQVPTAYNEPVLSYAPGSPEREEVLNNINHSTTRKWTFHYTLVAKR
jgi:hypothetical protein